MFCIFSLHHITLCADCLRIYCGVDYVVFLIINRICNYFCWRRERKWSSDSHPRNSMMRFNEMCLVKPLCSWQYCVPVELWWVCSPLKRFSRSETVSKNHQETILCIIYQSKLVIANTDVDWMPYAKPVGLKIFIYIHVANCDGFLWPFSVVKRSYSRGSDGVSGWSSWLWCGSLVLFMCLH